MHPTESSHESASTGAVDRANSIIERLDAGNTISYADIPMDDDTVWAAIRDRVVEVPGIGYRKAWGACAHGWCGPRCRRERIR